MMTTTVLLAACMPTEAPPDEPTDAPTVAVAEVPVRLSPAEVEAANETAGCDVFEVDDTSAQHIAEVGPSADELYDRRPGAAGDHLGNWIEAAVYTEAPDERAVVHNHEHGAVSVWYVPDAIAEAELDLLRRWAEARNEHLANDAGAGVIVAPFPEGLDDGAVVAFRSWTGGADCSAFDPVVADGVLLERFGDAPEGNLAPELDGVVEAATAA